MFNSDNSMGPADFAAMTGNNGFGGFAHEKTLGHRRHEGQRYYQAGEQRICNCKRQIGKQFSGDSVDENNRNKYAYCGQRRSRGNLRGAGNSRLHPRISHCTQPVGILNNYNRVVHKHSNADGKTRKGYHVYGYACEVHQRDCEDNADRNTDGCNRRRPDVSKEEQQHEYCE